MIDVGFEVLTKLVIAHAFGDITSFIVSKGKHPLHMICHCMFVGGVFYLFFPYVWVFWYMFLAHWLIDHLTYSERGDLLFEDQVLHFISIMVLWVPLGGFI